MIAFGVNDYLPCHRCAGSLLLTVRVPHAFTRPDGFLVEGTRGIGLCPSCDRADPVAQGVLAYFTVHETVVDETEAAALIAEWAERVTYRLQHTPPDEDRPGPDPGHEPEPLGPDPERP